MQYDDLFTFLEDIRVPGLICKAKGLTLHEIRGITSLMKMRLPENLERLFTLQNGVVDEKRKYYGDSRLIPGFNFLSLNDAIRLYDSFHEFELWPAHYFPILTSDWGEYIAVDIRTEVDTDRHFFLANDPPFTGEVQQIYDSENSFVSTVIQCYKQRIYYVNDYVVVYGDRRQKYVHIKNNPHSDFWRIW